jgi:asparagine synthase (glutamine-hydrolysing)
MCGLAGYLALREPGPEPWVLDAMGRRLAHRGPDAEGAFRDGPAGIGLVHRRLAILDLSEAGAQPMHSPSGRWAIAYNGEIYNHLELRAELEASGRAPPFRGHSDTETILALVEAYGIDETLGRLRGMFALALWDRAERRLTLARDRLGEKPLYHGRVGNLFVFASELAAFHALPGFAPEVDRQAVADLLRYSCVPGPASIYAGISKLPPACIATIAAGDSAPVERSYWRLTDVIRRTAPARAAPAPYDALVRRTEAVLTDAVQSQTLSDRPVGLFLSGGIDSSLVTALLASAGGGDRLRTYTIGFEDERLNEAEAARAVAEHLGTRHTEFVVTEADALGVAENLAEVFSEPFADSSQVPSVILSRLTRQDVVVALSGDGGDEMFGGYNRHVIGPKLWSRARLLPPGLRRAAAAAAGGVGAYLTGDVARRMKPVADRLGLPVTTVDKLAQFARAVGDAEDFEGFYAGLLGGPSEAGRLCPGARRGRLPLAASAVLPGTLADAERMMAWDALWYLPDDILVKVDRSAMASSLETRAPFLDPLVVEHAWSLPVSAKVHQGRGKRILRDILYRHVPRELIDRPKQGFAVPLDAWLRGPLRRWADDRLHAADMLEAGGIDAAGVDTLWRKHLGGRVNAGLTLWAAIMFVDWYAHARAQGSTATGERAARVARG